MHILYKYVPGKRHIVFWNNTSNFSEKFGTIQAIFRKNLEQYKQFSEKFGTIPAFFYIRLTSMFCILQSWTRLTCNTLYELLELERVRDISQLPRSAIPSMAMLLASAFSYLQISSAQQRTTTSNTEH